MKLKYLLEQGEDFALQYPETEMGISRAPNIPKHNHSSYEYLLEDIINKSTNTPIYSIVLDRIKGKILVDLGCGNIGTLSRAIWLALIGHAKAYIGIDLNACPSINTHNKEFKKMIAELNKPSLENLGDLETNNTIIKTVVNNFNEFLINAPDNSGYNFIINGLILTCEQTKSDLQENLSRVMQPGNIIIGHSVQNLHLPHYIQGPHKEVFVRYKNDSDGIYVIEKLEPNQKSIKECIILER